MPLPRADLDGHQVPDRFLHGLDRLLIHIRAHEPVTMARVDDEIRGADPQFRVEPRTDPGQIFVADRSDLADGHRVHGDNRGASRTVIQHEGPDVEAVVRGLRVRVGDVDLGGPCPELGRGSPRW